VRLVPGSGAVRAVVVRWLVCGGQQVVLGGSLLAFGNGGRLYGFLIHRLV